MKVYCGKNKGREAYKRPYKDGRPAKFRAFPPSKNDQPNEKPFETIEELALFLLKNSTWKTLVKETGETDRQVGDTIVIEGKIELAQLVT